MEKTIPKSRILQIRIFILREFSAVTLLMPMEKYMGFSEQYMEKLLFQILFFKLAGA